MEPAYFDATDGPLLGIYHPPGGTRERSLGVLLCCPGPQEYLTSHWAYRKLANLLAREGFHVFRFDYHGTGDSAGASDAGSLARWRDDVRVALREMKDVSGVRRASVVGCRLGAALAAEARIRVRDLVLWEPVVVGRTHVREMVEMHHRRFAHCLYPPPPPRNGSVGELLGLPFPPALQQEVESLDLGARPFACRAERVVLVTAEPRGDFETLAARIGSWAPSERPRLEWLRVEEDSTSSDGFLLSTLAQRQIAAALARPVDA